jgi:hypothetical protein
MPPLPSISRTLAKARLILTVDARRPADDPFKLPPALTGEIRTGIATLETNFGRGCSACLPRDTRMTYDKLEAALLRGHAGIRAIIGHTLLPTGISHAERLAVFTAYGWDRGLVGQLSESRLILLAELAIHAPHQISNPDWRYPTKLVELIAGLLEILHSCETGEPAPETAASLVSLEAHLANARQHYQTAGADPESSRELSRIGWQQRAS